MEHGRSRRALRDHKADETNLANHSLPGDALCPGGKKRRGCLDGIESSECMEGLISHKTMRKLQPRHSILWSGRLRRQILVCHAIISDTLPPPHVTLHPHLLWGGRRKARGGGGWGEMRQDRESKAGKQRTVAECKDVW